MTEETTRTLARLRQSFASSRTRPIAWRLEQLRGLDELVRSEERVLLDALAADLGRVEHEGFLSDCYAVRAGVQALHRGLPRWARARRVATPLPLWPARSSLRCEPLGVVLVIGSWNYPFNLTLLPLAAALAAGNAVVVKPSELAPASAGVLAELLPRYLDAAAVAVVEGGPDVAGALLDGGVDHCFFTGSTRVGREVAARAGRNLTPVTLELGGKSPAVVAADADVEVAARRIAWGKFMNAGQSCIAPDYVLVDERRKGALIEALAGAIEALYGPAPERSPDYARVATEAHAARLAGLLVGHGGTVAAGGELDVAARYVGPTIVVDPDVAAPLMVEEIFGPILPVLGVAGLDAAREFVAARPAPLALYLFGSDREALDAVAAGTRSGAVVVNATMLHFVSPTLPFGGVGSSGTGRYHGRAGFETFSHQRARLARPARPDLRFADPPYRRFSVRASRRALRLALDLWRPLPGAASGSGDGEDGLADHGAGT